MSLYQKHRPTELQQIKGNAELVRSLEIMLQDTATCPHAFLFHGPTGCGKTTIARIIANRLGCKGSDLREVDSADFRGIDTIREIRRVSVYLPMESPSMVWIIDECHKLTNDAQNALLKILEDTPKHVYFVLCTTDPQKLLPTVRGRCSQFQVAALDQAQMFAMLRAVVRKEEETLEKEVFDQIIETSGGLPRNALQVLQQVLSVPKEERLAAAKKIEEEAAQTIELCRALFKRAKWNTVAGILNGLKGQDAESIRRAVLGYCQGVLLRPADEPLAGLIMEEFIEPFYDSGFPQLVYACYVVTKN